VSHATISLAVFVFRDKDSRVRVVESDRNDEVDDAKKAPSEDHLRIGIYVDAAVDGDGKAFGGPGEGARSRSCTDECLIFATTSVGTKMAKPR
jgi:hypothetical protein